MLSNEGRNGPNVNIENIAEVYYYVRMDTLEQYTVYVSKEALPKPEEKIDWAEVAYRLRNSSKPLLTLSLICLLGGFAYFLISIIFHAENQTSLYKIFLWALLSYALIWLSTKNVKPYQSTTNQTYKTVPVQDIKESLSRWGIDLISTSNLFEILEKGDHELFINIREHIIEKLFPRGEKKTKRVMKIFDTIWFCCEENQKTLPDYESISFEVEGRKYKNVSAGYINCLTSAPVSQI